MKHGDKAMTETEKLKKTKQQKTYILAYFITFKVWMCKALFSTESDLIERRYR